MSAIRKFVRRFGKDARGTTATLFAFSLIPMLVGAGIAIDYIRVSRAEQQLQAALDGAALMMAKSEGESDQTRKDVGEKYFSANFDATAIGGEVNPTFIVTSETVTAKADLDLPTTLLGLVGVKNVEMSMKAEVPRPTRGRAEVVMVLDYSYSMTENNKFGRMAIVARDFISTLQAERESLASLKFGVVPFSDFVAVSMPSSNVVSESGSGMWTGCTADRGYPYNIGDSSPTESAATRWGNSGISNSACTSYRDKGLTIIPLTTDYDMVKSRIAAMQPYNLTHIALGAEFGWQLLTANAPFTQAEEHSAKDNHKFLILLTDGKQTSKGHGPDGAHSVSQAESNLLSICQGMKDDGIIVFTIGYDLADAATLNRLEACATPGKFFRAEEMGEDLKTSFKEIAESIRLSMLYLAK